MRKTSRWTGDECIAAAPDLWFEGLGFPHPVKPAKDPIRGANLIGSRWRPGCRGSAGLAPETAVVTRPDFEHVPEKWDRFFDKDMGKIKGRLECIPMRSGEQEQ